MPNYQNRKLALFLQGMQSGSQGALQGMQAEDAEKKLQLASLLTRSNDAHKLDLETQRDAAKIKAGHEEDTNTSQQRIATAESLLAKHPNMGVNVSKEGISFSPKDNTLALRNADQKIINGVTKDYGSLAELDAAIKEVERVTDRDGKGGIVTNPNAKTKSVGTLKSAVPSPIMGLSELIGKIPGAQTLGIGAEEGTTEERKALERLQLIYQKSMTGARTSDSMAAREKAAMGMMASGDPNLVAKAVRSLGQTAKSRYQVAQSKAAKAPGVLDEVHGMSGGNPLDFYNKIPEDMPIGYSPAKVEAAAPTQGPPTSPAPDAGPLAGASPVTGTQAPQATMSPSPAPGIPSFEEFKALKRAGKLGGAGVR